MIQSDIYGVVLNDQAELDRLAPEFAQAPYGRAPIAPVVYMKPGAALACGDVTVQPGETVRVAPTVALMFGRAASRCGADDALGHVAATCIAIDIALDHDSYYRPVVHLANRDGFLNLGPWVAPAYPDVVALHADNEPIHSWPLDRLARPIPQLIADLSEFMTFKPGDILLVGLPGDAPRISGSQTLTASAEGLRSAHARLREARA